MRPGLELRFALRSLRRAPALTFVAILSLAFGTGAATALFSLVNTVTLKPLAYREPGKLLFIREVVRPLAHIYPSLPVNMQHFRFWREQARSFESLSAVSAGRMMLAAQGESEMVGTGFVSANLFDTLGVAPQAGRAFRPEEEQRGRGRVAVLTDGFWRRRFGASPDIVGRNIQLNSGGVTVIGVLPATFHFPHKSDLGALAGLPERTEIFMPLPTADSGWEGDYDYIVFGRVKPGVSAASAVAELDVLEERIAAEHKLAPGLRVDARPLQEVISSPVRTTLVVLLSAVMLLVLIVCVNLANLLLARGSARTRELSVRVAIGATTARLMLSGLAEALLLTCAGGLLGLGAAAGALTLFVRTAPVDLPRLDEVRLDGGVIVFAFGLSLVCALLFGLLPAFRMSRTDPQAALRGGAHTVSGSRAGLRLRQWLVASEVTLSTLLLVLAGLLVSSLWHVLRVDRGFAAERALDVALSLPARYRTPADVVGFYDRAAERLRALPGVRAVAVASRVPLNGESNVNHVEVDGASALDPATRQLIMVNDRFVGEDYFTALGIPLLHGRAIEAGDRDRNVAVISERLAARLWPGQDPIGKVLSSGSGVRSATVVGVVGDVRATRLERDPTLMIYVPYWKQPWQVSDLVVLPAADERDLAMQVRRAIQSVDPGIPAPQMRTMGELVSESVAHRRFQMRVASAFALSALLLAALGIYGVVAYGVASRRREFGIRLALGATGGDIGRLVIESGMRPVVIGFLAGIAGALAAGRLIGSLLFGIRVADQPTLAAVAAVVLGIAALACFAPARAVIRIDPLSVLRDE